MPPTCDEAALPEIMEVVAAPLLRGNFPGIQQSDIILHWLHRWATVEATGGGRAPLPSEITEKGAAPPSHALYQIRDLGEGRMENAAIYT